MQFHSVKQDDTRQFSKITAEAAVAMWTIKPPQDWTTETVASVLQIGHGHQTEDNNYHINIENHEIAITTEANLSKVLQISTSDQAETISCELANLFKTEGFGILIINGQSCAITKESSRFWVFIPNSLSKYNSFKSIQNMVNHIIKEFGHGHIEFSIRKIKATNSENTAKNTSISEESKQNETLKQHPRIFIPLEELRAVQECKKKNRRHRPKKYRIETTKNASESKQCFESSSSSKSVSECFTEDQEDKSCQQKTFTSADVSPPSDNIDFQFRGQNHDSNNHRHQEQSEGEDSGYAEYLGVDNIKKDIHQEGLIEDEIQQRLQKEMDMLRQMMEMKLRAEKMRIEQELRQELLSKQNECLTPKYKQLTKKQQKAAVVNVPVQLPVHQYEKTKGFADMSGEQYEAILQ